MIDQRALEAAVRAFNTTPWPIDGSTDTMPAVRNAIETYEAAKFKTIEIDRRLWFVANFDFHRALGMGKDLDDALWEAIQAFVGQQSFEKGPPSPSSTPPAAEDDK